MIEHGLAQTRNRNDYTYFLAETENIFLFKPEIIKDIFYGLITLKGNRANSIKHIDHDVLGCPPGTIASQGCKIDQLKLVSKQKQIPQLLKIFVNFTAISAEKFGKNKKRVRLQWHPATFQPPVISLDEFLNYIQAAKDSPYFQISPGISRIQLNSIFERDFNFITEIRMADSLISVYEQLPDDYNDSISFGIDYVVASKRGSTMDYLIQFKALSVMINHQVFKTAERID